MGTTGKPGVKPGRIGLLDHGPFSLGFLVALGALTAWWLFGLVLDISSILVLVVVALFLAAGLNPLVEWFMRRQIHGRRMGRHWAVVAVITLVIATLALFVAAIVPVIGDQVKLITDSAPGWLDKLLQNHQVQKWNSDYELIEKAKDYIADGDLAKNLFGGVLGFGIAVVSALGNFLVVVILTLYFLASLPAIKQALYQLAPASRRTRVAELGDRIVQGVGAYVSGAFLVAVCAGLCSLVFLFLVGLGEYAVALSFVIGSLSLIPMVGATIAMVIVSAIGFAQSPGIGIACLIYYNAYQQLENYFIYPTVMKKSVDVPGAITLISALIGAALLGVVGALMSVPVAAALLLILREVFLKRQDAL